MHRERRERVEKERQDRLVALEQELAAKQHRAQRLRQERLESKKCSSTRFSRRPLGPELNTQECPSTTNTVQCDPLQKLPPTHAMPSMLFDTRRFEPRRVETRRPVKELDTGEISEPSMATDQRSFSQVNSRAADDEILGIIPSEPTCYERPIPNQSHRVESRWQKYLPASIKSSLAKNNEGLKRGLVAPQLLSRPSSAASSIGRRAKETFMSLGQENQNYSPRHDDIWTGRGLIVDDTELRKKSIFDSPDRSSDSSSRGSYTLIQPKATSLEPQQAPADSLSQTPHPQTNLPIAVPTTSPRLTTLTENCPLVGDGLQNTTPQQPQASCQRPFTKPARNLSSLGQNNGQGLTPIYPNATPSSFVSPPDTFMPMAPRRRGNVGRAAILQGIITGSAQFVDALAKRYGDELNSQIPIPTRLMHLFSYNPTSCARPLAIAVKASSSELVRGFIEADADVFVTDYAGRTLLHELFLPHPETIELSETENWPQPFRLPELTRPSMNLMPSPRSSVLQTPRINEHEPHFINRGQPGRCRLIEAAQTPWLMNMDNRATIVELLVSAGLSPSIRDADGKYASDYARAWLWQAHRELEDPETSFTDKISACCVRATCLSLLTLEDYMRLSYLAPLTTNYKVRKLVKPRLDFEVDGKHVMISSSMLKDNCTPERILPMVRGKSNGRSTRLRKSAMLRSPADPLVLFLSFTRRHKDHPGLLRILEFLGAAFTDLDSTGRLCS